MDIFNICTNLRATGVKITGMGTSETVVIVNYFFVHSFFSIFLNSGDSDDCVSLWQWLNVPFCNRFFTAEKSYSEILK